MNRNLSNTINGAVASYLETHDTKYETAYLKAVMPFVKLRAEITCAGSTRWNVDDLYSILLEDAWRLFKIYKPKEGKEFHYLLLHQLNNKVINYIKNTTGRVCRLCFVCGERATKGAKECENCGSNLKKPNIYTQAYSEIPKAMSYEPNYLKEIEDREMVTKILKVVKKKDLKTYIILTLMLAGYNKSSISRMFGNMAQNALNSRITKCSRIIKDIGGL